MSCHRFTDSLASPKYSANTEVSVAHWNHGHHVSNQKYDDIVSNLVVVLKQKKYKVKIMV